MVLKKVVNVENYTTQNAFQPCAAFTSHCKHWELRNSMTIRRKQMPCIQFPIPSGCYSALPIIWIQNEHHPNLCSVCTEKERKRIKSQMSSLPISTWTHPKCKNPQITYQTYKLLKCAYERHLYVQQKANVGMTLTWKQYLVLLWSRV